VLALSFCHLNNLEFLTLTNCNLKELPENFGELKELIELNLSYNLIKKLPPSILQCYKLQEVDLRGCPIKYNFIFSQLYHLEYFRELLLEIE
ncbi:MAG: leucine-rich repeat domain-containing protein, partial [Promethearchaeota archaeon]